MEKLLYVFLTITFTLHGAAFVVLGLTRRKTYYLILTGTFIFLTTIYVMKLEGWMWSVPGTDLPLTWLLRIGATLCTLGYLRVIYNEEGSWLRKVTHRRKTRDQMSQRRLP